jgi:hypothetical protein
MLLAHKNYWSQKKKPVDKLCCLSFCPFLLRHDRVHCRNRPDEPERRLLPRGKALREIVVVVLLESGNSSGRGGGGGGGLVRRRMVLWVRFARALLGVKEEGERDSHSC